MSSPDELIQHFPNLFDIEGAAELLKVSQRTIRRLLSDGSISYNRVGHQVRITEQDLVRYMAGTWVPATSS
jgi:excisionase family DNA binding protein